MLRRLCSQKRLSASSPLSLSEDNNKLVIFDVDQSVDYLFSFVGGSHLTSSHAWKTESRATWSEKRLPAKFLWTWPSRFPSLTNGSGKQEAAEMVHMASPTLGGDSSTGQGVCRLCSLQLPCRSLGGGTLTGKCSPGSSSCPGEVRWAAAPECGRAA